MTSWWREGSDPDYRFSLANERTSLAWIRTSLGLVGAAVAAVEFLPAPAATTRVLAVLLASCGGAAAVLAFVRWRTVERAMRRHERLPHRPLVAGLALMSATVLVAGVAVAVVALQQLR